MSKKPLILTISIVLILFLCALVGYYFIIAKNSDGTGNSPSIFRSFFPFGGGSQTVTTATSTSTEPGVSTEPVDFLKKLRKLSPEPVAGAGALDVKAGTVVRYIEKATGHIYEAELFSPKQGRISNTTIPLVYDAIWSSSNNSLIARYLEEDDQSVDTYSLNIKQTSTTTENAVSAIAFPANISDVSINGGQVFYLQQNNAVSNGYVSGTDGSKKKQVWASPVTEVASQFVNAKTIALTTKPAQNIPGYMYFVDANTGGVKMVLGSILGLSTLTNNTESQVLYIEQSDNVKMFVYDTKAKSSTGISPATFPEKCVWGKKTANTLYCAVPEEKLDGYSLTSWYQGRQTYTDNIWKLDTKNTTASIIENLSDDGGESIDVVKPILSENEQYLVFINKKDGSLWSLDLTK